MSGTNGQADGSAAAGDGLPLPGLRRFTRERQTSPALEHCEMCSEPLAPDHRHLLELNTRRILCTCDACSLLFGYPGSGGGKYRAIPRRYLVLPDFQMTDEQWDELMIPVNMVYIFHSTPAKRVIAFYPSPAGATESSLDLQSWEVLVRNNPVLNELEPDVEALLINRVRTDREYFIVPIDACYQLVGLIRLSWKGLGGGEEVWKGIKDFFADIRAKSRPVGGDADARPEL
ncbi:MAG: hypothetical protein JOZ71_05240 [Ktedonobacteraceae bacterium]|nr:hypothetical protein [Ktedonobacteraceae bacterium]